MSIPHLQVILGTTRPGRFSEKVGAWLMDRMGQRDDLSVELVDLRDHPLPIYELEVAPARAGREYETAAVRRLGEVLDRADGYVMVTGEYNHGYSSSLKNAIDHVFPELHRKPVTFAAYGQVGGARAVEQLRQVVIELEMAPLRHAVHILPSTLIAAREADPFSTDVFAELDPKLDIAVSDLVWWADALATARNGGRAR